MSVGDAMFTLFQIKTLEGWAGSCDPPIFKYRKSRVQDGENPIVSGDPNCIDGIARPIYKNMEGAHWLYFVSYILITAYCLMNIFTGVFVESMMRSRYEKDSANAVIMKLKAKHAEFRAARGTAKKKIVRAGKSLSRTINTRLSLLSPRLRSSPSSGEKQVALPAPTADAAPATRPPRTAPRRSADDERAASPAPAPADATGAKPALSFMQVLVRRRRARACRARRLASTRLGQHAPEPRQELEWPQDGRLPGASSPRRSGRSSRRTFATGYSSTDEERDGEDDRRGARADAATATAVARRRAWR